MVLVVAGCATVQPPGDVVSNAEKETRYKTRVADIQTFNHWTLDGKLAISDGKDGGSGRLQWSVEPGLSELDFRGTFGRGAWQLDIRPDQAVLNFASGETWRAPDVSSLVRDHVGWEVPVDALSWWVRGLAAPGPVDVRLLDDDGRMLSLSQGGWEVEYKKYKEFSGAAMPVRLDARRGEHHVKFIMREWTFPVQSENDS